MRFTVKNEQFQLTSPHIGSSGKRENSPDKAMPFSAQISEAISAGKKHRFRYRM